MANILDEIKREIETMEPEACLEKLKADLAASSTAEEWTRSETSMDGWIVASVPGTAMLRIFLRHDGVTKFAKQREQRTKTR